MNKFKEIEKQFNEKQAIAKKQIKDEPKRLKRFFKWIAYWFVFPWKWLFVNIRDFRTFIIFGIVFLVISCEVWVPYIIYFITKDIWWVGIGTACWTFWALPGTPFLVICITLTIIIKGLFNKLVRKKEK